MTDLDTLDAATPEFFAARLEGVFEHAPWVAAATAADRPFGTLSALHAGLMRTLHAAPEDTLRRFLAAHPPLTAGALAPDLTEASRQEQGGLPLGEVIGPAALEALNREYRDRHGFPFIICLRAHAAAEVLRHFRHRLPRDTRTETAAALDEVARITWLRLAVRVGEGRR